MMDLTNALICPLCKGERLSPAGRQTDRRKGLIGDWMLYDCGVCGSTMLLPTPSAQELERYYAEYSSGETVNFSTSRWVEYPRLRRVLHWLRGDVDPRDFIQEQPGIRLLDYGCGQAGYLVEFRARGLAVSGAEMSVSVVRACQEKGLDVRQVEDPECIPFPDVTFDIVYLMQVFEHVRNPHRFMAELARVLKPGGTLYLAVPNAHSLWRRVFGSNWVSGWFAPFHLFHYDRDGLAHLANRAGFDVVECWTRTPESWFRLNLKAWLYPNENRLDEFSCVVDSAPVRMLLMVVLRLLELFVRERDCLVVKYIRRDAGTRV